MAVGAALLAGASLAIDAGAAHQSKRGSVAFAASGSGQAPNFLFVLVDDQATNSFHRRFMPETFRAIVDRGTEFTNALAAPPLCCPDRAGLLTGQYPHNHQVWSNHPGYASLTGRSNTLPAWLQKAGYRTGFFGKFLNRYTEVRGLNPAPGFDRWFAYTDEPSTYYDYGISDDGAAARYGHDRSEYSTDVLTREARAFIRDSRDRGEPFFGWLAYAAPHLNSVTAGPCTGRNPVPPDVATYRSFADEALPRPKGFNERRIEDKPRRIARLPRLDGATIATMTRRWRCTLAAMKEVDRGMGQLMTELQRDGALSHTIVIYLSDNGAFFGEHRIPSGKALVYEPALRVPFAVYVPPAYRTGPPASVRGAVVANQDIAPTILDYVDRFAGQPAPPCNPPGDCRRLDGRSLAPLLGGEGRWRSGRGVLAEADARSASSAKRASLRRRIDPECNCAYEAVRTHRFLFNKLASGGGELYDLRADPHELSNRARSPRYSRVRRRLARRLARLERCSGQRGPELPSSVPFCG